MVNTQGIKITWILCIGSKLWAIRGRNQLNRLARVEFSERYLPVVPLFGLCSSLTSEPMPLCQHAGKKTNKSAAVVSVETKQWRPFNPTSRENPPVSVSTADSECRQLPTTRHSLVAAQVYPGNILRGVHG